MESFATTRDAGLRSESEALQYLVARGLRFVERNFRWRGGEIDLIMEDGGGVLVFVEVRSASDRSSWLRYSITRAKRRRLVHSAATYAHRRAGARGRPVRWDFVWVEGRPPRCRIEHWRNVEL